MRARIRATLVLWLCAYMYVAAGFLKPISTRVCRVPCTKQCKQKLPLRLFATQPQSLLERLEVGGNERNGVVIIAGFEQFNIQLYKEAAERVTTEFPGSPVAAFTDADLVSNSAEVQKALSSAKVIFVSLVFDFAQVAYLQSQLEHIPVRFVFESALELMSSTQVGSFNMAAGANGGGAPAPVKALLRQFGSGREEDKMSAYVNFLKIGPKLLKWIPGVQKGSKLYDVRSWLTVYSFWSQSGLDNVSNMLRFIVKEYCGAVPLPQAPGQAAEPVAEVVEQPNVGVYHPEHTGYFDTPAQYLQWYQDSHPRVGATMPTVGLLLYRKHVITNQGYIPNLIRLMESEGLLPVPVFINGVEGHTVVRDLFSSRYESDRSSLKQGWVVVDAVVNTIGFPLVGGPAGSMEGGRGIEASREILTAKNVPYVVAAPLIIQDVASFEQNGVTGLQSVVLFSLPELDGAIEPVVLGGLVGGDRITLIPERVRRLTSRLKSRISLRMAPPSERQINLLVYGFPPNVGAVGTAALLNVGQSLSALFSKLSANGYSVPAVDGEALVRALKVLANDASASSVRRAQKELDRLKLPFRAVGREVTWLELRSFLGKAMTAKMESQWGPLETFTGLGSSGPGKLLCLGLEVGSAFVGIQPLVGTEGDPMRLLFSRDLTPHPQYAAFYQYLHEKSLPSEQGQGQGQGLGQGQGQGGRRPTALVHFGMHGTVEWLPGSPLGNTADSWSDKLLGDDVNVYLYAANNPSESMLAKRRGYATIVSHNVPPYSRAGLYRELSALKDALREYRETGTEEAVPVIASLIGRAGLFTDCPFPSVDGRGELTMDQCDDLLAGAPSTKQAFLSSFRAYLEQLWSYLQELEVRLFSAGLHVIGREMDEGELQGYLEGIYGGGGEQGQGGGLDEGVLRAVAEAAVRGDTFADVLWAASASSSSSASPSSGAGAGVGVAWAGPIGLQIQTPRSLAPSPQTGVDWLLAIPPELRLALRLLGRGSAVEAAEILWLKLVGDEERLVDILVANASPLSSSSASGAGAGAGSLAEAVKTALALRNNPALEMQGILSGIEGGYVAAAPGGDIIRDGRGVLPTGRNIHSLDPYRIPSALALERGRRAAELVLEQQRKTSPDGAFPETIAVTLWGLDTIKTKGESVAIALALLGAVPVREATGRIVKFDLVPLKELNRPRIDVLCSMSGIFRDSFGNLLTLLDDVCKAAAEADEPPELNFVRKHFLDMQSRGLDGAAARLFSNPAGDFGSLVGDQVGAGTWTNSSELGETWERRNSFSYGAGAENGVSRPDVLKSLLNSTDRIVQEVDCVEYGLTDIQEYFGNTGGLLRAAENNRQAGGERGRGRVGVSIIEAFEKEVKPRELDDTLRVEYRSKLLNPAWAAAMVKQGSGGAYEVSGRLTAMVGWAGVAGNEAVPSFVWEGAAERYALDDKMADFLKSQNPEAFRNIVKRLLEGDGRGMWSPSVEVKERLLELFSDAEDAIEGVE